MSQITAGGIVSDATSEAAGYGKAPKTHSNADASVDPETGEARARGKGRGPKGSDGNASIAVSDEDGEFATSADADGSSKDRTKTSVDAHGKAKLSDTDYEGGSTSSAKSENAHTRSDTRFAQGGGGLSSEANAEGTSDGESTSATDVEAHFTGDNISHRTRARGTGSDMSSTSAKGNLLVERLGQTIELVSEAESLSEQSSDAEVRNIVIKTASGTIVRSIARSGSTGRSVSDPTAGIDIAMPDGIGCADGHARRSPGGRGARQCGHCDPGGAGVGSISRPPDVARAH